MKVVYTDAVQATERSCWFAEFVPTHFMSPEQLNLVNNHRFHKSSCSIRFHFAARAGATGQVTIWWIPANVKAYNLDMLQNFCMVNDQTKDMSLVLPDTDEYSFAADAMHGVIAFMVRGVVGDEGRLPLTVVMSVEISNVSGRLSAPGLYELKPKFKIEFQADVLVQHQLTKAYVTAEELKKGKE